MLFIQRDCWAQHYAPKMDERCRSRWQTTNDSWRLNEADIYVGIVLKYLYQALDSAGNTLDLLLTASRDSKVAKRFLCQVYTQTPRVTNSDKNESYVKAIAELKSQVSFQTTASTAR